MHALLPAAVMTLLSASPLWAVPSVTFVDVPPTIASAYADRLERELSRNGVRVVLVAALPGRAEEMARQGCSAPHECPSVFAGEGGVGAVLRVALFGGDTGYVARIELISTTTGSRLASFSSDNTGVVALIDRLEGDVHGLAERTGASLGYALPVRQNLKRWALAPLAGTVLLVGSGSILLGSAYSDYRSLDSLHPETRPLGTNEAFRRVEDGQRKQGLGGVLVGLGVMSLLTATLLYTAEEEPPLAGMVSQLRLTAGPGGLMLSGRLP